jgi:HK97 family phage major capsid protein
MGELTVAQLAVPGERPVAAGWRGALYRPDAPGAVLDGQPWAASWPAYLRALTDRNDPAARTFIAAAMGERIPSEGGFLVPEYLRSQVLSYMTGAIVRPHAAVLPMSSLRLPVPLLDNASQASAAQALGGLTFAFTEEAAPITASGSGFGQITLEARKAAGYMANVPNELIDDGAGAFGDYLARVIAQGLAWFEDDYFIGTNGTGTGCPQSLINAPCAVQVTRANSSDPPVLADIALMAKALHPASKQAGMTPGITSVCWLLSDSAFDALLEIYLAVGSPATQAVSPSNWMSLGDGEHVGPSILGLPALITDHQPAAGTTGDVILADLRNYLIGDRLEMTVELSKLGGGFIYDASNIRVRSRVDGRYWIQSASTTEVNQSVSPVVVLK